MHNFPRVVEERLHWSHLKKSLTFKRVYYQTSFLFFYLYLSFCVCSDTNLRVKYCHKTEQGWQPSLLLSLLDAVYHPTTFSTPLWFNQTTAQYRWLTVHRGFRLFHIKRDCLIPSPPVICVCISNTAPCLCAPTRGYVSDTPASAVSVNYFWLYQSAQRITKASSVFRTAAAHSEHECSHMLLDGKKKGRKKEIISAPGNRKPFLGSHPLSRLCSHTVSSC